MILVTAHCPIKGHSLQSGSGRGILAKNRSSSICSCKMGQKELAGTMIARPMLALITVSERILPVGLSTNIGLSASIAARTAEVVNPARVVLKTLQLPAFRTSEAAATSSGSMFFIVLSPLRERLPELRPILFSFRTTFRKFSFFERERYRVSYTTCVERL